MTHRGRGEPHPSELDLAHGLDRTVGAEVEGQAVSERHGWVGGFAFFFSMKRVVVL